MKPNTNLKNYDHVNCDAYYAKKLYPNLKNALMAVAIGNPEMGATFLPHLGPKDYPLFRGTHRPVDRPEGTAKDKLDHAQGKFTNIRYLDLGWWLGGRPRHNVWIGTFADATRDGLIVPVFAGLKRLGCCIGYIPARHKAATLPDRIAVWNATKCGRVEIHRRINDGRNSDMFDEIVAWFPI